MFPRTVFCRCARQLNKLQAHGKVLLRGKERRFLIQPEAQIDKIAGDFAEIALTVIADGDGIGSIFIGKGENLNLLADRSSGSAGDGIGTIEIEFGAGW